MDADTIAQTAVKLGAAQVPCELAEALDLAKSLRPSVIAEIGSLTGGSLYAWRQVCERVYGITLLNHHQYIGGEEQRIDPHGAVMRFGDSHDPDSRSWLEHELAGAPVDVLVIDADHVFDAVKQDLVVYGPLVRPGGVILLHDVLLKPPKFLDDNFQVWRLWEQLEECCDTFVIGVDVGWGVIRVREEDDLPALTAGMKFTEPGKMLA